MAFRLRSASRLAAATLLLGFGLTRIASAQDVMQLDLEFRNSLSRGSPPQEQSGRRDTSAAQGHIDVARRHSRRHRHNKV